METPLYDPKGDARIVTWRELCFIRYGFEGVGARALAMRRDIDRANVERMVKSGWSTDAVLATLL